MYYRQAARPLFHWFLGSSFATSARGIDLTPRSSSAEPRPSRVGETRALGEVAAPLVADSSLGTSASLPAIAGSGYGEGVVGETAPAADGPAGARSISIFLSTPPTCDPTVGRPTPPDVKLLRAAVPGAVGAGVVPTGPALAGMTLSTRAPELTAVVRGATTETPPLRFIEAVGTPRP